MSSSDGDESLHERPETSRDQIDKKELGDWQSKDEEITFSVHEQETTIVPDSHNSTRSRYDRFQHIETTAAASSLCNETAIITNGPEETKRYIESLGSSVYVSERPEIIYRPPSDCVLTSEQRVVLRCLQPPRPPSPEPLIIKKVCGDPSPPLPPIIIREFPQSPPSPPPIVLREQPPIPPPRLPGETVICHGPPLPPPLRSVIVESFPRAPEKQPDIIIERWLPYGDPPPRRFIFQESSSPPTQYPKPYHRIIICKDVRINRTQKLERQGVIPEDPVAYIARYGSSLLDRERLERQVRNAGVTGDISCSLLSSFRNVTTQGDIIGSEHLHEISRHGHSSSGGFRGERITCATGGDGTTLSSRNYSSSTSYYYGDSTAGETARQTEVGHRVD